MVTYAPRPADEPNPWSEETWNLTQQSLFIRQNGMGRATQRAAEAGTKIGAPRKRVVAPPRPVVIVKGRPGAPGADGASPDLSGYLTIAQAMALFG